MPLKLFFALHEIQAKFTKEQLCTVIVLGRKRGKVPSLYLVSSKFYCGNVFHFSKFFVLTQASSIKFLMALYNSKQHLVIIQMKS